MYTNYTPILPFYRKRNYWTEGRISMHRCTTFYLTVSIQGSRVKYILHINTEGMVVPSAAGDFNNLVIFVDRLAGTSRVELEEVKPLPLL